jgi:hypothetical protein
MTDTTLTITPEYDEDPTVVSDVEIEVEKEQLHNGRVPIYGQTEVTFDVDIEITDDDALEAFAEITSTPVFYVSLPPVWDDKPFIPAETLHDD